MLMYDTLYETLKQLCLIGVLLYRNNLWKFIYYLPIKPVFWNIFWLIFQFLPFLCARRGQLQFCGLFK